MALSLRRRHLCSGLFVALQMLFDGSAFFGNAKWGRLCYCAWTPRSDLKYGCCSLAQVRKLLWWTGCPWTWFSSRLLPTSRLLVVYRQWIMIIGCAEARLVAESFRFYWFCVPWVCRSCHSCQQNLDCQAYITSIDFRMPILRYVVGQCLVESGCSEAPWLDETLAAILLWCMLFCFVLNRKCMFLFKIGLGREPSWHCFIPSTSGFAFFSRAALHCFANEEAHVWHIAMSNFLVFVDMEFVTAAYHISTYQECRLANPLSGGWRVENSFCLIRAANQSILGSLRSPVVHNWLSSVVSCLLCLLGSGVVGRSYERPFFRTAWVLLKRWSCQLSYSTSTNVPEIGVSFITVVAHQAV